nr:hypothetical protein [Bacteroides caecigallinarum]
MFLAVGIDSGTGVVVGIGVVGSKAGAGEVLACHVEVQTGDFVQTLCHLLVGLAVDVDVDDADVCHHTQSAARCCDVDCHYPLEDLEELACGLELVIAQVVEVEDGIARAVGGVLEEASLAALACPYRCGELHFPVARLVLVAKLYHGAHLVHCGFELAVADVSNPFGGVDYAFCLFFCEAGENCYLHNLGFKMISKKVCRGQR